MRNRTSLFLPLAFMAALGGMFGASASIDDAPKIAPRSKGSGHTKRKVHGQPFGKCHNNPLARR